MPTHGALGKAILKKGTRQNIFQKKSIYRDTFSRALHPNIRVIFLKELTTIFDDIVQTLLNRTPVTSIVPEVVGINQVLFRQL
jgi:hypothetical protein